VRALEDDKAKASDELLPVADTVATDDFFTGLQLGDRKGHANLAPVVVHVEELGAILIEESYALDRVALRLTAASLHLPRLLDHLAVHGDTDLCQIASREPRRAHLVGVEELDAAHADSVRIFEPEPDALDRCDQMRVLCVWPGEVDVLVGDIRNTPERKLT